MGKVADLSEFYRGQIVMARRLGRSISETTRLVTNSRNAGETKSRGQAVGHPRDIEEKGHHRLPLLVKQNRRLAVAQLKV
ncbi:HTH_Tnp_Tc3_2 domain-containing protein [Trichonephila clavipes]|nr:HTH_Tnp_Tc3_2 domain-containing protein [Trichonephila clavipes]